MKGVFLLLFATISYLSNNHIEKWTNDIVDCGECLNPETPLWETVFGFPMPLICDGRQQPEEPPTWWQRCWDGIKTPFHISSDVTGFPALFSADGLPTQLKEWISGCSTHELVLWASCAIVGCILLMKIIRGKRQRQTKRRKHVKGIPISRRKTKLDLEIIGLEHRNVRICEPNIVLQRLLDEERRKVFNIANIQPLRIHQEIELPRFEINAPVQRRPVSLESYMYLTEQRKHFRHQDEMPKRAFGLSQSWSSGTAITARETVEKCDPLEHCNTHHTHADSTVASEPGKTLNGYDRSAYTVKFVTLASEVDRIFSKQDSNTVSSYDCHNIAHTIGSDESEGSRIVLSMWNCNELDADSTKGTHKSVTFANDTNEIIDESEISCSSSSTENHTIDKHFADRNDDLQMSSELSNIDMDLDSVQDTDYIVKSQNKSFSSNAKTRDASTEVYAKQDASTNTTGDFHVEDVHDLQYRDGLSAARLRCPIDDHHELDTCNREYSGSIVCDKSTQADFPENSEESVVKSLDCHVSSQTCVGGYENVPFQGSCSTAREHLMLECDLQDEAEIIPVNETSGLMFDRGNCFLTSSPVQNPEVELLGSEQCSKTKIGKDSAVAHFSPTCSQATRRQRPNRLLQDLKFQTGSNIGRALYSPGARDKSLEDLAEGHLDTGDGPMIVTRRSPHQELGVSFLENSNVNNTNETGLLDVTDINNSLSFSEGHGVFEFLLMFTAQSAYRLSKHLWQEQQSRDDIKVVTISNWDEDEAHGDIFVMPSPVKESSRNTRSASTSAIDMSEDSSNLFNSENSGNIDKAEDSSCMDQAEDSSYMDKAEDSSYIDKAEDSRYTDQAEDSSYMEKAEDSSYMEKVEDSSYMDKAEESSDIGKADDSSYRDKAKESSYIDKAEDLSYMEKAADSSYMEKTEDSSYMDKAEHTTSMNNSECLSYMDKLEHRSFVLSPDTTCSVTAGETCPLYNGGILDMSTSPQVYRKSTRNELYQANAEFCSSNRYCTATDNLENDKDNLALVNSDVSEEGLVDDKQELVE